MTAPEVDRRWVIHCDGSALPNPGRMGLGAVMTQPDGLRHTLSLATHAVGCNNEAELRALTLALRELKTMGATEVLAYSDNSVLVEQLSAAQTKPIARLAALYDEARGLLASFERASVEWIPRHRNGEADALARGALGLAPKGIAKPKKKRR